MGRYDVERPWHSWADLRVQVRLLPWHWSLLPQVYRDAGSLSIFEWLFLTIEYWTWDRGQIACRPPTNRDSAPPRDTDREPANSVYFGSTPGAGVER